MVACPYLIRKRGMPVGVRVRDSFRRDIFDKIRGKFPGRCPQDRSWERPTATIHSWAYNGWPSRKRGDLGKKWEITDGKGSCSCACFRDLLVADAEGSRAQVLFLCIVRTGRRWFHVRSALVSTAQRLHVTPRYCSDKGLFGADVKRME